MLVPPTRSDPKKTGLRFLQYYAPHDVFHPGQDFNWGSRADADKGQEVVSPTAAVVEYVSPAGTNGGLGNFVVLYHSRHGVWTRYLHLDAVSVKKGDVLKPGQRIGALGDSGTTSSHLHLEVLNSKGVEFIKGGELPYGKYPRGLSKQAVASMFLDPVAWLRDAPQVDVTDPKKKLTQAENALKWASETRKPMLLRLIERLSRMVKSGH